MMREKLLEKSFCRMCAKNKNWKCRVGKNAQFGCLTFQKGGDIFINYKTRAGKDYQSEKRNKPPIYSIWVDCKRFSAILSEMMR
jgi:hypothetical protein